ncbi:hypothetical protein [Pedobacter sp. L105]|uniref:hypothetical protein n=1 Tax=Pedobacter sp. L105 TaxID=1641871 RepID=UPI00131DE300|nr:hypothetical protein [Pedobacter sp. L105]
MDSEKLTKEEIFGQINERSIFYRGSILNFCIALEKAMDLFVASYLTNDRYKQQEIMVLLLDRMTFEGKRTTVKSILYKAEEKAGFVKTKKNSYKHSALIEEIREINQIRNYMAHYLLATYKEAYERYPEEIGFIEFRDSPKCFWMNHETFVNMMNKISHAHDQMNSLVLPCK